MIGIFRAAAGLQVCEKSGWKFCFINGLAAQHWAEPRVTRDADMTLLTGWGGEERYVRALLERYPARIPDAARFARENRVLLLKTDDGIGIDIALGAIPFEAEAVERARDVEVAPGLRLRLCSAEDLIVLKAFAGRAIDWHDVEMVVSRQGADRLD